MPEKSDRHCPEWASWIVEDDVGGGAVGGHSVPPNTARSRPLFDRHAQVVDQMTGEPMPGVRYRLDWSGGSVEGVTSATGHTQRIRADQAETAVIHILSENE